MIYRTPPEDFSPAFELSSCYVEHDGRFVALHRNDDKSQGGKWGTVAGKLDPGETPLEAMVREMREETRLEVAPQDLTFLTTVFVRYPTHDFTYHMFRLEMSGRPEIRLEPKEHQDYRWVTAEEMLGLPIVDDLDECIRITHLS